MKITKHKTGKEKKETAKILIKKKQLRVYIINRFEVMHEILFKNMGWDTYFNFYKFKIILQVFCPWFKKKVAIF